MLERWGGIIERGQRVAKGTTHLQGGCYGITGSKLEDLPLNSQLYRFILPLNQL